MSRTPQDLAQMLAQARKMPEGDARIALLEDLVRHADASGDPRLAFDTRMELTAAYQHGGETGKGFVTFSWCLAAYDRDPGRFTTHDDWLLRWQYKWTVTSLKRFPEVPLDRSYRALDDMERRYLAGGHSLHAVYTLRCGVADHVGDLEAGDKWYRKWCAAPRDENSDCVACDPTGRLYHLAARGLDEEAVAVAEPVLEGRITCTVQPQSIQSGLLSPYLRTGRLDEAREAHRRAYRAIRGNRDYLDDLGRHLEFCAVTGNEVHGLEILERHLHWLDRPSDPMSLLEAAGSAALLLRRLREAGHGGQRVRRPGSGERPPSEPEVAELEDELRATALHLAARFDERNGSGYQGELLVSKLAATPVVEYLPLSRVRRRRTGATVPPAATTESGPSPGATESGLSPGAAEPALDDLALEQLLDLAEESYPRHRIAQAQAALRRFDELAGENEIDAVLAARRTDLQGSEQAESGDLTAAERTWRDVAERYVVLGEDARGRVALGRVGMVCLRTERVAEGVALIEASAGYLRDHGTPAQWAKAEERRAIAYASTGRAEQALALLDELSADEAARDVVPAADIALARGLALGSLGPAHETEALEQLAQARQGYRADGNLRQYAFTSLHHGRLLAGQLKAAEAAEALAEAAAHAGHDPELRAAALVMRGGMLARAVAVESPDGSQVGSEVPAEWLEEAVDDLVEAVGIFTERGMPQAWYVRFDLALALARTGRLLDAAESAEEGLSGLEGLSTGDATEAAAGFRELLVSLYRGLGENEQALRQLDALVEFLADGPPDALARVHETAGDLLDEMDRDALAAERFEAAAQAYRGSGDPFGEVRGNRRRALSLHWSGDSDAGLALVAETERLIASLPAEDPATDWERGALRFNHAKMLAGLERVAEAVDQARAALDSFQRAEAPDDAKHAEALVAQLTAQQPGGSG